MSELISFRDIQPGFRHPELVRHELTRVEAAVLDPNYANKQPGIKSVKEAFGLSDADVYYMPTGTSANLTAIEAMCPRSFDAVISPATGHINNYETGATESRGHKIITVEAPDAKLTPALIDKALEPYVGNSNERVVPRGVYLTQITELGTVYSKDELAALIAHAKSKDLLTYLDGARLAMGIASESADITTEEFGQLGLDIFSVGGTKNGGVGEALIVSNDDLKADMPHYVMQGGFLLKRPEVYDWQFERFFGQDEFWLQLARHANAMAGLLRAGLKDVGIELLHDGDANHAFVPMKNSDVEKLQKEYDFSAWGKIDDDTTKIRLVTGWLTTEDHIDGLLKRIGLLS